MKIGGDVLQKEQVYAALVTRWLVDRDTSLCTIKNGTPEWREWQRYFVDHLGFEPLAMKMVRRGQIEKMTVPTKWPDEFDPEFKPK